MNIKVSQLRAFQKLAANIKNNNNILPITDYLKFEPGKITKTALSSFIQFDCEGIDDTLLVDEKQLFNLLGVTNSEFINIVKRGNKTIISDTRDTLSCQVQPVEHFPPIPEMIGDIVELSPSFAEALHIASFFPLASEQIPSVKSFVMVGKKTVCATDGFIAFHTPIEEDVTIVIDKKIASSVSKLPLNAFGHVDNYYFFFSEGVLMGFSTQEIGYFDMTSVTTTKNAKLAFTASSSDLTSFNSLAMKSADYALVTMTKGSVKMENSLFDIQLQRDMENIELDGEFTYNPTSMNQLLSAIQCEELDFYEGDRMYFIKSQDYNFTTLIMKINKPTNK